jgi:hypothetical protein
LWLSSPIFANKSVFTGKNGDIEPIIDFNFPDFNLIQNSWRGPTLSACLLKPSSSQESTQSCWSFVLSMVYGE